MGWHTDCFGNISGQASDRFNTKQLTRSSVMKTQIAIAMLVAAMSGTALAAQTQTDSKAGQTGATQQGQAGQAGSMNQQGQSGQAGSTEGTTHQTQSGQTGTAMPKNEAMSARTYLELDKDRDGYLSKDEAASVDGLENRWTELDENTDGRLDQSEFSRFETQEKGADEGQKGADEAQKKGADEGQTVNKDSQKSKTQTN
jgi:hypothetical protein